MEIAIFFPQLQGRFPLINRRNPSTHPWTVGSSMGGSNHLTTEALLP
ncbi:hypothetical protein SynMEDNS5_01483 [Synechococcus sp. MEDNS5]|nr:hypothetical protein SynMEDNS5_01483 [Synechococcus sp. MEDNS5]